MGTDFLQSRAVTEESLAENEIASRLLRSRGADADEVNRIKLEVVKRVGAGRIPRNSEILRVAKREFSSDLAPILRLKRVRSISGVSIVSVMTSPRGCPHGRCSYCPMQPGVPMSYVGSEPAAMRGMQNNYEPFAQVAARVKQLRAIGHNVSKVELIIQGGTFPAAPVQYQRHFVKRCLDSLNGYESETLDDAKLAAETARTRNVGLTIETKPDWAKRSHIDTMLELGATRVEIGVQAIDDEVYNLVNRGHTVDDVVESFGIAKDAGFKLVAHMMPGLPGMTPEKDLESFRKLLEEPEFKPDMLKIYPCLVVKGTEIYDWWAKGEYQPYDDEQAVELIARIKEMVPPWVRIMRIQREIPANEIVAGPRKGNLRELAIAKLTENGKRCRCIRCREVGHRQLKEKQVLCQGDLELRQETYEASGGTEVFLAIEEPVSDTIVGYVRMRIPSEEAHRAEIAEAGCAVIRELHVYGPAVPVGEREESAWQHKGFGRFLLRKAEELASSKFVARKMVIISALGTKEYYMRLGYRHDGPYMSKPIPPNENS